MQTIEFQDRKIAEVYVMSENFNLINDQDKFSESLINKEIENQINKIGFKDKEELRGFIRDFVVGKNEKRIKKIELDEKEIIKTVKETLSLCFPVFEDEIIKIFVFPTIDNFSINKMGGTNGFCVSKNIIFVGLHPFSGWQEKLRSAISHELAHSLSPSYDMGKLKLGEGIIFEGIAEHFKEKFVDKEMSPLIKAVPKNEALKIFTDLKGKLNEDSFDIYNDVFYGAGKYPLWAGYAIGYYLVKNYLENKKNIDWKKLLRENPNKILKEILENY